MPRLTFAVPRRIPPPVESVNFIHAGVNFSYGLTSFGFAQNFGINNVGQLGNNSTNFTNTPVSLGGLVKTFCKIAGTGGFDNVNNTGWAIDKNGLVWGWGNNSFGQIGDNTITQRLTPISIRGDRKTFCEISVGSRGTAKCIDQYGRAWGWGVNSQGEIGNNSAASQRTPVSVLGVVKTFCKIESGYSHTISIDKNGRLWTWGRNSFGQLGDTTTTSKSTPVSVLGSVKTFCVISAGVEHCLAIEKNGRVWAWGQGADGRLGDNTTVSKRTPVFIGGSSKTFCKITGSNVNSFAIDKNGKAWGWGSNSQGQLGDNTFNNRNTPVSVAGANKTFCDVRLGNSHCLAIDNYGRVWGWGLSSAGELGPNVPLAVTPVSVCGTPKTFSGITAGYNHVIAITNNGTLWSWGLGNNGRLGNNSTNRAHTPISVCGLTKTFCHVSAGSSHSMGIDKFGRLWGWGDNTNGRIGDNSISERTTPVCVCGAIKTFCGISAGESHTLSIDQYGKVWGWGLNTNGQLGDNSTTSRRTPFAILGGTKTFSLVSAGGSHSLSIDLRGKAWGWGLNTNGQLGDNTIVSKRTPVSVLGANKTFCKISAGNNHSMSIDLRGRVWGWGLNTNGQLGNKTTTQRSTPFAIAGVLKTFCQISAGVSFTTAIDKYGKAWAWGVNSAGQLGDSTLTQRNTPVSVRGVNKTFCQIQSGQLFTIAIDQYGKSWGWGRYTFGQLGNNLNTATPILIGYL